MDAKGKVKFFNSFIFHPILMQFLQKDYLYGLLMDHTEFAILSNIVFFFCKLLSFNKKNTNQPNNLNNSCPFLYHT